MMSNLKGQTDLSGTEEGLEKLGRINYYMNRAGDPLDQQVENQAILIRARGRVVCDLIRKGDLDEDAQAGLMSIFSQTLSYIRIPKPVNVEHGIEFQEEHGE